MKTHILLRQMQVAISRVSVIASMGTLSTLVSVQADVTAGSSQTYGLRTDVSIVGGLLSVTDQEGTASATAPAPYNSSSSLVPVNVGIGTSVNVLGIGLTDIDAVDATGVFNSTITSNVNGGVGSRTTSALSEIAGTSGGGGAPFSLTLGDTQALLLNPDPLLELSASLIRSNSSISGDYGSLVGVGTSTINGFSLNLNGGSALTLDTLLTGAGFNLGSDFLADGTLLTPNMTVGLNALGLAGASLIFNRQVTTGDGISSLALETTAIYLDVNSALPLVGNALDVEMEVATAVASQAAVAPVPEPGSAILFALGIVTLLGRRRWKV